MTGTTRCKFHCNEVIKRSHRNHGEPDSFLYEAKFSVVYDGSPENKEFFKWTPTGNLSVGVYKEDRFQPGQDYYIDITPAAALEGVKA